MLHGHTKIELKNEKTGEIQVVEKDNMITNAIPNLFSIWAPTVVNVLNSTGINSLIPLNTKGMGGLLCFQNNLTEDSDNMWIQQPSENPITSYADSGTTVSSDNRKGLKNVSESVSLENGYKYVWDFGTDKGNGQISAIALTYNTYANKLVMDRLLHVVPSNSSAANYNITDHFKELLYGAVSYDEDTDIITCIHSIDSNNVEYVKRRLGYRTFGIKTDIFICERLSVQNISFTGEPGITENLIWRDSTDYYYGAYIDSNTLHVRRIKKSNLTYDTNFKIDLTNSVFGKIGTIKNDTSSYNYYGYFEIVENYMYISGRRPGYNTMFIKLNLEDSNDLTSNYTNATLSTNGLCFISRYRDYIIGHGFILYKDLSYTEVYTGLQENSYCRIITTKKGGFMYIYGGSSNSTRIYLDYLTGYLATINNLDTPVTKTSEQSMKITYTITEE